MRTSGGYTGSSRGRMHRNSQGHCPKSPRRCPRFVPVDQPLRRLVSLVIVARLLSRSPRLVIDGLARTRWLLVPVLLRLRLGWSVASGSAGR
ncbi:hypothetical protein E5345_06195 [Propionibacterium sp. NM47_B9-13]|nr:hypothetical protein E5345_06195 [Propionibacterium sp. NM47_B9-13]